jgi:SulP family sulfate permease
MSASWKTVYPELSGALAAAIASLPGAFAFGMLAFSPLGTDYLAAGILASVTACIMVGFWAAILGGTPTLVSGSKAPTALIIAGLISQLMHFDPLLVNGVAPVPMVLALTFLAIFLNGVFQVIFGLLNFGRIIKYISMPVVSGILNGTVVLIVISQLSNLFGLDRMSSSLDIFIHLDQIQILTTLVGLLTFVIMLREKPLLPFLPKPLIGLLGGTLLYYFFREIVGPEHLGSTIGEFPPFVPNLDQLLPLLQITSDGPLVKALPLVLIAGFNIALLEAVDTLLAAVSLRTVTKVRSDMRRELIGQGIGNMVSAVFGGISGSGFIGRSVVNFQSGGRTRLSNAVCPVFILLIMLFFSPVMGMLPKAAMAGMVLFIAWNIFDRWSLELLLGVILHKAQRKRQLLQDVVVILMVVTTTIFWDIATAMVLGVAVSIVILLVEMSNSLIKRIKRGNLTRSKNHYHQEAETLLARDGRQVLILELEGAIFFSSAEDLLSRLLKESEDGVRYVILDMKHVSRIDNTGIQILMQINATLTDTCGHLLLSHVHKQHPAWESMAFAGLIDDVGEEWVFNDTDQALETCEQIILRGLSKSYSTGMDFPLNEFELLKNFIPEELELLKKRIIRKIFASGSMVFFQGDPNGGVYLVLGGTANIIVNIEGEDRGVRVDSFAAGTVFGEMSLIDGEPRSASVQAGGELTCYYLGQDQFEALESEQPAIAIKILSNCTRLLAARLRSSNTIVSQLERT